MSLTGTRRGKRPALPRAAAVALLLAAGVIWCVQAINSAQRSSGNDLVGYFQASRALYSGADPYHLQNRFPYIYPLFLAEVIRPLADIPTAPASVFWFVVQSACLWYVLRTAGLHAGIHESDRTLSAVAIIAVFGDVLQSEFLNGQVNLMVLALGVAAVHRADRNPHIASGLLGAAIALKLTPAILLLYWLVERRYRIVVESGIWAAVLIASPWLVVHDRLWSLYSSYLHDFILARAVSADTHGSSIFFTTYGFVEWLAGSASGSRLTVSVSGIVLASLAFWHWRLRGRTTTLPRSVAWIYVAVTLLLSPISEVHHLTALIPSALVTTSAIWNRAGGRVVAAGTALFVALIWIGRFDRTGPWYFLAVVCLIAAACAALQRGREDSP